jgi:hypothetical protein
MAFNSSDSSPKWPKVADAVIKAVLRAVKNGEFSEDKAIKRFARSPSWVWTAIDPESQLLVVIDVGARTLSMVQRVVHQLVQRFAPDGVPMFLSDGFRESLPAILGHCGVWGHPEVAKTKARCPSRDGGRCHRYSRRRGENLPGADASWPSSTGSSSGQWNR